MDENIEDVKKEKLQQLKSQMQQKEMEEQKKKQLEKQKKQILRKILSSEARSRLTNIRTARPDFAEKIEVQLIQLARTGRVNLPINDNQFKKILKKLQDEKSISIQRK